MSDCRLDRLKLHNIGAPFRKPTFHMIELVLKICWSNEWSGFDGHHNFIVSVIGHSCVENRKPFEILIITGFTELSVLRFVCKYIFLLWIGKLIETIDQHVSGDLQENELFRREYIIFHDSQKFHFFFFFTYLDNLLMFLYANSGFNSLKQICPSKTRCDKNTDWTPRLWTFQIWNFHPLHRMKSSGPLAVTNPSITLYDRSTYDFENLNMHTYFILL